MRTETSEELGTLLNGEEFEDFQSTSQPGPSLPPSPPSPRVSSLASPKLIACLLVLSVAIANQSLWRSEALPELSPSNWLGSVDAVSGASLCLACVLYAVALLRWGPQAAARVVGAGVVAQLVCELWEALMTPLTPVEEVIAVVKSYVAKRGSLAAAWFFGGALVGLHFGRPQKVAFAIAGVFTRTLTEVLTYAVAGDATGLTTLLPCTCAPLLLGLLVT